MQCHECAPAASTNRSVDAPGKVKLVDTTAGPAATGKGEATRTRTRGDKAADGTKPGKRKAHAYGKKRNASKGKRDHGASAEQNSNGKGLALGRNGQAGTRGTTRSAEVQQRNANRKTTRVAEKPVTTAQPKTAAPQSTTPQGKAKSKAPEVVVPLVTPEAPQQRASSRSRSQGKGTAGEAVTETLTP